MKRIARAGTAIALAVLAAAGTASTATAGPSTTHKAAFGYTSVRRNIPTGAVRFSVGSPDVRDGGTLPASGWANGLGCTGTNQPIRLDWSRAPAGTRSYAVTLFDPDAPTGSGFWHWQVWDIPATDTALGATPPDGAVTGTNDAGAADYIGPCPPTGDIPHHYQFTVYALDTPSLDLPATSTPAIAAFTMSTHILGYARLTALAQR